MGENIIIRPVNVADNLALAEMIKGVFEEFNAPRTGTVYADPTTNDLYQLFKTDRSALWVAALGDKIMGCCGVYPTEGLPDDCAELVKFYLPLYARGRGIGRSLMEHAVQSAVEYGYKRLYLESFPEFSKAISIYKQQGFEEIDHPMGNSGHSSCNVWMIKTLQN